MGKLGTDPGFQTGGVGVKRIFFFFFSNTHPCSIKKLSTKKNIQKSLFLNILKYSQLSTKTKDMKHYCFLIQSSMKKGLDTLLNFENHL